MTKLDIKDCRRNFFTEVSFHVGVRIVRSRKALGLNQTELAESIGVHRTTLVAFENGIREPSATELFIIADACNVEPDWLLTGKERQSYHSIEMTIEEILILLNGFSKSEKKKLLKSLFDEFLI